MTPRLRLDADTIVATALESVDSGSRTIMAFLGHLAVAATRAPSADSKGLELRVATSPIFPS